MPQDPSRPSWKGDDRSKSPPPPAAGGGARYSWKPTDSSAGPPARRAKSALVLGLGGIVLAGLAWLVYQLMPTRPTCVIVIASDSRPVADQLALPLNIYGHRGARDFLAWANSGDRAQRKWANMLGDRAAPWPLATGRREDDWLSAISRLSEDNLILFFSQPGGTDEAGKPFLFDEQGGRYDVAKLLQALRGINKRKFVIFDATTIPTDWRNGVLVNNFAAGLAAIDQEIASDPNLLILCASGPDQRSWTSEELGRTVFAHYLIEGLSGGAIGGKPGPIHPNELVQYVRTKVDDWVQKNRADSQRPFRQEPFLLPKDAADRSPQFTLAYGDPNYKESPPPDKRPLREAELLAAWKRHDDLAAKTPGPWVNSPRLWRRYRELLIRHELFLRAGEDEAASALRSILGATAEKLDAARAAPGAQALSAGLAVPAALGRDVAVNTVKIQELLDSKEPLSLNLKSLAAGDETVPRMKLFAALLDRIAEKPNQLVELASRFSEADDAGVSRPIEAHLAFMLAKYPVPPGGARPAPDLLRQALAVRRLADEAALMIGGQSGHPYSERLSQSLAESVARADRYRRRGEDLLFCAPSHHGEAKKMLDSAQAGYDAVRQASAPIRAACDARDRGFADAVALAEWAALESAAIPEMMLKKPEDHWAALHQLADRIEKLDPLNTNPSPEAMTDLQTLANDANRMLAEAHNVYRGSVGSLLAAPEAATQSYRQHADNALVVPGVLRAEDRVKLVVRVREIGWKLAQGGEKPPAGKAVSEAELARQQARYARAILGESTVDRLAGTSGTKFADLVDGPALGTQLAAIWRKLQSETDRAANDDPSKTPVPLPWRERLGLVAGSSIEPPTEPALLARAERWSATFRRLARRCELDHWYDEHGKPFSTKLAKRYLQCLPESEATEAIRLLDQRIEKGVFKIQPPAERVLTTERSVSPKFVVRGMDAHFEPGLATVAPKISNTTLSITGSADPRPVAIDRDQDDRVNLVAPQPLDRLGEAPEVALTLFGYYRGQVENNAIARLPIKPIPDLSVNRPAPPATAQIAARADDDLDLGAIAIIFDCSGSMNKGDKLAAAKTALQKFQAELPPGALVTLWAYSHDGSPDDNIQQLLPLTAWDKSDPRRANLLADKVRDLRAKYLTPLLDTMVRAAEDRAFKDAPGFKTMLVLTDGCDQKTDGKPGKEYNEAVAARFREQFVDKDRGISIRMVLFQLGEDREAAETQFKDIDAVPTPSSKTEAANAEQLSELLAASVRPRVALFRNNAQVKESAFLAKRPTEPLDWYPEPPLTTFGEYEVRCRNASQRTLIEPGDRLALRVRKGGSGLKLTRLLMCDDAARSGLRMLDGLTDESPFALGLINDFIDGGGTTMRGKFTLDVRKPARPDVDLVRLERPAFVWWEFKAIGRKDVPSRSRVTSLHGIPAPAYELASDRWPLEAGNRLPPAVEVWASVTEPDAADTREIPPGQNLLDVAIDGNAAVIESAGFERFEIPNSDGTTTEQDCFVVRVYSPQGGRYWAGVTGEVKAQVQRYYNDAKRSTAAFWLPADAQGRPVRLKLTNVEAAKSHPATKRLAREMPEKR